MSTEKRKSSFLRFLKRLGFVAAAIYLVLCGLLFFFQEKLLFHPKPFSQNHADSLFDTFDPKLVEEAKFKMADEITISGWLTHDTSKNKKPLIIYYPGNAEEVSHLINKKDSMKGCHFLLMNYRGYGTSEGEPSEEKFFSDALEIFDKMKMRADVDTTNIFVFGRSIGTGVAVHVTKKRKVKGCVLITPYDCMSELAAEKYPAFPVSLLLKHPFNSIEGAETIETPVLCYIAAQDEIIPPLHAYNLMMKWKGKKRVKIFDDASHNSIVKEKNYWRGISSFISRLSNGK